MFYTFICFIKKKKKMYMFYCRNRRTKVTLEVIYLFYYGFYTKFITVIRISVKSNKVIK